MEPPDDWERLLADLATGVWRLRRRCRQPADGPRDELRRAGRDVEALWDRLAEAGVEVLDHDGEPYDAGQSLKVVAFQPVQGADRERVLETIRPTVYYQSRWIQMGEVIVGSPQE